MLPVSGPCSLASLLAGGGECLHYKPTNSYADSFDSAADFDGGRIFNVPPFIIHHLNQFPDVAICIWDPDIVRSFCNAPVTTMPDEFLNKYFEPESAIVSVSSIHEAMQTDPASSQSVLRHHLLSGLTERRVGLYSNFHENLIYAEGYDQAETIRLAFM